MNTNNTTKALVESAILTSLMVIIVLLSLYVPLFTLVGFFIVPALIALISTMNGMKYGVLSVVIALIVCAIMYDPFTSVALLSIFGLTGLAQGYAIKRNKSASEIILISAVTFIAMIALNYAATTFIVGQDLIKQLFINLDKTKHIYVDMYMKLGLSKEKINEMMSTIPTYYSFKMLLPTSIILGGTGMSFICYVITSKLFKRFKLEIPKLKRFREWYPSPKLVMSVMVILLISFAMKAMKIGNGEYYLFNAFNFFACLFDINALALISFLLGKYNVAKPLIVIICIFILTTPLLGNVIYIFGVMDYIMDYRKLDTMRRNIRK